MAAETQRLQASLPRGYCHFLQRIFAVAQFGMNVNGTFQVLPGHINCHPFLLNLMVDDMPLFQLFGNILDRNAQFDHQHHDVVRQVARS